MADAQPFRAVRYTGAAGPLAELVAPPYDVVGEDERAELYTRSPYNVLHLTLPESAGDAGRLYREWLAAGVLEQDDEPSTWVSVEQYVGPDGVSRERRGALVSIPAEPYGSGMVLPHERTHARIRDDRLDLLRATRVQPEPIFVLTDGPWAVASPPRAPDVEVDGTSLWRIDAPGDLPGQLLIADGHHRYEAAVDLARESREPIRIMALVVSKDDPGVRPFPTHRVFARRPDLAVLHEGESVARPDRGAERARHRARRPTGRGRIPARPRRDRARRGWLRHGARRPARAGRHRLHATGRRGGGGRRRGTADVAFLLREPRVDDVFAVARSGGRMPQKSTYFFPKPLSGIVFHPLDR